MNLQELLAKLKNLLIQFSIKIGFPPDDPYQPIPVNPPAPQPEHVSQIPALCEGIFEAEGGQKAAGYKINNPGDIRYYPGNKYVQSLGAIASVSGFAKFPTMEVGIKACQTLCSDACLGALKAYAGTMMLSQFCAVYAQPPVLANYVNVVLKHLKVGTTAQTQIKDLL